MLHFHSMDIPPPLFPPLISTTESEIVSSFTHPGLAPHNPARRCCPISMICAPPVTWAKQTHHQATTTSIHLALELCLCFCWANLWTVSSWCRQATIPSTASVIVFSIVGDPRRMVEWWSTWGGSQHHLCLVSKNLIPSFRSPPPIDPEALLTINNYENESKSVSVWFFAWSSRLKGCAGAKN